MEETRENKMGTMSTNKLLVTMSLPMIISMLVQALYNIVDSIFVARVDADQYALAAVSLAFPVQSLMIAVAAGTGVGINAYLSKSLGMKKMGEVRKTAQNAILLAFLSWLAAFLLGFFGVEIFYRFLTPTAEIRSYGNDYLSIIMMFSMGVFFQITFERLLQSTGKTIYNMITQGTGAIINIILDPILIFGYFGFPKLGAAGAAIATVIGQTIAALLGLIFNIKYNKEIHLSLKGFRPNGRIIKKIYAVGFPAIIMQSITSFMTLALNKICYLFPENVAKNGVNVLGVYFKVQSFVFMPVFGLNNGMTPIIAYNYGANHKKRIMSTMRLGFIMAVAYLLLGFILFETIPDLMLKLFTSDEQMIRMGTIAFREIAPSFIFAGFSIIIIATLQALSHGVYSMIVSICRQLVVLVPVAFILAKVFDTINVIWIAFPIAECVSLALCLLFFRSVYRKTIKPLAD
ncbi:MAG: MATE family efflux transporter [Ruminococcus sp.]|nr:MATE family efflux transporter [Ruminococcus sp.]